ncbi:ABC transporter substrate-binding protein [Alteromonas sediminis]|uniref:ABC transporter substrate-binding protein n=1 Tax=Alteromonas sediminis TaxID=2259342 RepID=A0A3N5XX32_9ALTE|nr:ABC transporter substrate-binding protein [Alteromonas sediminis]RPJ64913.1 ABC transporter substrate-binding protein [Alteromonas sediminis]
MSKITAAVGLMFLCLGLCTFVNTSQAEDSPPIVIGIDADMSGSASDGGKAIYRGAKIAVDEINRSGGVLGRPLRLEIKDHRGNPARGLRNLKAFSETDNLVAVLGGVHTPVILQELDFLHQQSMLMLVPWAAGTAIVDNGHTPNFVFRASIRDSEAATIILNSIKTRGLSRVALILERTGWGRSNQASMTQIAKQLNIEIVHVSWINWRQKTFEDEMHLIAQSAPDAVVLVTNAPEGAVAVSALLQNNATRSLPVVSHWGIAAGSFVETLGLPALQSLDLRVLQTFHFSNASDPVLAERVLESYRAQFDDDATSHNIPGAVGLAHAYDLVHMLRLAIIKAQAIDADSVRQGLKMLTAYKGLVKSYKTPFADVQDALWSQDYLLTEYNQSGFLTPIVDSP